MWQQYIKWAQPYNRPKVRRGLWLVGVILLLISAWLWWNYASINTSKVFWGTINNSLATSAFSKDVSSSSDSAKLSQKQQINLGNQKVVSSQSTVEQTKDKQTTTVKTESIATPTANYSRYTSIEASNNDKALDFSSVTNQWGKQVVDNNGNGIFAQAIFDIVPFANLSASKRATAITGMKTGNVYTIDYANIKKYNQNGRLIYDYTLSIAPASYIATLKQVDQLMGLNQLAKLDVAKYQGNEAVKVTISVDARARQLVGISYEGSNQKETFSDYGVAHKVTIPSKTIDQATLQAKLSAILGQR